MLKCEYMVMVLRVFFFLCLDKSQFSRICDARMPLEVRSTSTGTMMPVIVDVDFVDILFVISRRERFKCMTSPSRGVLLSLGMKREWIEMLRFHDDDDGCTAKQPVSQVAAEAKNCVWE